MFVSSFFYYSEQTSHHGEKNSVSSFSIHLFHFIIHHSSFVGFSFPSPLTRFTLTHPSSPSLLFPFSHSLLLSIFIYLSVSNYPSICLSFVRSLSSPFLPLPVSITVPHLPVHPSLSDTPPVFSRLRVSGRLSVSRRVIHLSFRCPSEEWTAIYPPTE